MKKVLSSILISLIILVNLLAPFSVGFDKNNIEISKNEAKAESSIIPLSINSHSPLLRKTYVGIDGIFSSLENIEVKDLAIAYYISDDQNDLKNKTSFIQTGDDFDVRIKNDNGKIISYDYWFGKQIEQFTNKKGTFDFEEDKTYYVYVRAVRLNLKEPINGNDTMLIGESKIEQFIGGKLSATGLYNITDEAKTEFLEAKKNAEANGSTEEQAIILAQKNVGNEKDGLYNKEDSNPRKMPACGISSGEKIIGCIAQAIYYVVFVPTSYLFALAGVFFDSTFAYSVQDSSYRSAFVVQGWGLVRDICNMFFIFVLLYVAIATTLSLNSVKTKETIINVVIIGLFINFSLFAAQLMIDASNITARIFYNADTIVIDVKDGANGVTDWTLGGAKPTEEGIISLSAGLVNKVNPQNIVLQSQKINNIEDKGGSAASDKDKGTIDISSFILITLIASAVNIVGFIVFLTIGMMFIARVIGLWIAMIIAPLAFFTYILPEQMAGIKMIGWKNWWPDTLKMAFLAPVFIFFLYLILKFLELDLIADTKKEFGLTWLIGTLMPFAFIMFFLMKAKKIATDMAGEFGEMATKAGSAIGGFALGAATGGTAMLMRSTLGRYGNSMANNEELKEKAANGNIMAKLKLGAATKLGAGSFDARNTKAGAAASKGLGVDMGKAKEGGYTKMKADQIAASQKRAKELELGEGSHEKQELNRAEAALKGLQNENSHDIQQIEGKLKGARQRVDDANKAFAIDPSAENKEKASKANMEVRQLNADKSNISSGGLVMQKDADGNIMHDANGNGIPDGSGKYHTLDGKISETEVKNARKDEVDAMANLASVQTAVTNEGNTALATRTAEIQTINQKRKDAEDAAKQATTDAVNASANAPAIAAKNVADALSAAVAAENLALAMPSDKNKSAALIARTAANNAPAEAAKYVADTKKTADNAPALEAKALADAQHKEQEEINNAQAKYLETTTASNNKLNKAQTAATNASAKASTANTAAAGGTSKSMNDLEYKDIPDAHHHLEQGNNRRKTNIANNLESSESKIFNLITTGGEYSTSGANQAAHAIRMDVKTEGGGH